MLIRAQLLRIRGIKSLLIYRYLIKYKFYLKSLIKDSYYLNY